MMISEVDSRIRKLVRSRATGAFLTAGEEWTTEPTMATVFPSFEAAKAAVLQKRIADAELYYLFGQQPSRYDFAISL